MVESIFEQIRNGETTVLILVVATLCALATIAMTALLVLNNNSKSSGSLKASCTVDFSAQSNFPLIYKFSFPSVSEVVVTGDLVLPKTISTITLDCSDASMSVAPLKLPSSLEPVYKIDGIPESYLTWSDCLANKKIKTAEIVFRPRAATVAVNNVLHFDIVLCDTVAQFATWLNR